MATFTAKWGNLEALKQFQAACLALGSGGAMNVARLAFNQACDKAATKVKHELVLATALSYRDVNGAITLIRAQSSTQWTYQMKGAGPYFSFSHFLPRAVPPLGVVARPWWQSRLYPKTFIIESMGNNVFKRVGPGRMDIEKLYGPSVGREMERDPIPTIWAQEIDKNVQPAIERKLQSFLPW